MQEFNQDNYKNSIKKAQELMENSINRSHGTDHIQEVEKHALEIYKELEEKGTLSKDVTKEVVRLTVWWHDVFTSGYLQLDPRSRYKEGRNSAEIFEKYNKSKFSKEVIKKMKYAISIHNKKISYFLSNKDVYTQLAQILIEADCIDGLSLKRTQEAYKDYPEWLYTLGHRAYTKKVYNDFLKLPQTEYAKKMYKLKMKDF